MKFIKSSRSARLAAVVSVATVTALTFTGCAPTDTTPGSDEVTIKVGNLATSDNAAARQYTLDKIEQFEDANPGIKVEAEETTWDPQTFTAQLAANTVPTVLEVPFTETRGLISRQQVYNLTDILKDDAAFQALNPVAVAGATGTDGSYYGIPIAVDSLGLIINRAVFEEAGLNPDEPLTTWDDVSEAAATITEKTDAAGFAMLSTQNQGGWILTTLSAAFGGEVQALDGDTATANVNNPGTKAALQWLADNREYLGANALLDFAAASPAYSAGDYGMLVGAAGWYNNFTSVQGLDPNDFGLFPLPQAPDGLGALGGGTINIVTANATKAQAEAAVKWIKFFKLDPYVDEKRAQEEAAANAKDGRAVPAVGLPLLEKSQWDKYLGWIQDDVNIPVDNIKTFTESALPVLNEPPVEAQQVYATLDPVVQAVLTDSNANIDSLLSDAQKKVADILDRAQR